MSVFTLNRFLLTFFLFLILCFLNVFVCEEFNEESIVTFDAKELGVINGVFVEDIVEFRGLPYAIPPINDRRWKIATMKTKLNEEDEEYYDATEYSHICPQAGNLSEEPDQSEDCLNLNIYAPNYIVDEFSEIEEKKLPVMVYIHGGAFVIGSNRDPFIDGKEICKRDVILVTINYRLGVFGFLAHPYLSKTDPDHPSNFGLLDQKVALEWIHRYIRHFGGDPDNITIFGESAGAMSTSYLISSKYHSSVGSDLPISEIPFKRAIIQSAPMSLVLTTTEEAEVYGQRFIKSLGYSKDPSTKEAMDYLLSLGTNTLLDATPSFENNRQVFFHANYIDGYESEFGSFLPTLDSNHFFENPIKIFGDDDAFSDEIDIMIGTTKDEGTMFVWFAFPLIDVTEEVYRSIISNLFEDHVKFFGNHDSISNITKAVFDIYDSNDDLTTPFETLSTIQGDMLFQCGSIEAAKNLKNKGHKNVYKYVFDHKPTTGIQTLGSYHVGDLPFVFGKTPGGIFPELFTEEEKELSNRIIDYWTTFAKEGEFKNDKWVPFDEKESTMIFNVDEDYISSSFKEEECNFWNQIYPNGVLGLYYSETLRDEPTLSRIANGPIKEIMTNKEVMDKITRVVIYTILGTIGTIFYCLFFKPNPEEEVRRERKKLKNASTKKKFTKSKSKSQRLKGKKRR